MVRRGDVEIDLAARKVTKGGDLVHLTPTEFALLREFASNPGVLLTHATLFRRVWGRGYETQTEYTRVYMARLRAKLENPSGPPLFLTEPRSGYRLRGRPIKRRSFTVRSRRRRNVRVLFTVAVVLSRVRAT